MEFNKVLLSLVLVNGVSGVCLAFDVDNVNDMVARFGSVSIDTKSLDQKQALELAKKFVEKGNTDTFWISSILRAQFSLDTTIDKLGDKNSGVFTPAQFTAMKDLLNGADRSARQNAFDRMAAVTSSSGSGSGSAPVALTPEQQTLKANVEHGGSVYYADDLKRQFAILENPSSSAADRQRAADLILVSQIVGKYQVDGNNKQRSNSILKDTLDKRADGATQLMHAALDGDISNDLLAALVRLGVDKNDSIQAAGSSWNAARFAKELKNDEARAIYIALL